MKKLDQVRRSQSEDICVLLRDVQGAPHVELRVYRRPEGPGGDPLPGTEAIAVPVNVLQDLLRMLAQAQKRLAQDGLVQTKSGDPDLLPSAAPRGFRSDARREPRVPVKLSVGCRLMNAGVPHSGTAVFGEVKDLSIGGAQIWLPERFSLFSKMEVLMRIGGLDFQGRADVVGAEVHPTREGYRHSMRWQGLSNHAKATLSQAIARR
ncbi:MAG: PilZ domain-containing protein [Candidatus Methylomirabilales bacterium]